MSNIEFREIVARDMPIFWNDYGLLNLNDKYLLADSGVLMDDKGNLIWSVNLEHYFSKAVYVKDKEIIITNRTLSFGMGGDFHLGIACIDMKTGEYKWKYLYDEGKTRDNLRNKGPDINLVRNIGAVDIFKGCIYADGFEVDLDKGNYKYIGEVKRKIIQNDNIINSKVVKSLKERLDLYSENAEQIRVEIDVVYIEGQEFSKEGYFFNKCDFYMSSNDSIYIFGIPAKKNPRNAILFKYSKTQKDIVEEIELPFRFAPYEAYDFCGKGVLFILRAGLWLFEGSWFYDK